MTTKPIIILGGGLWGGLLAYRLQSLRPDVKYVLYEKEPALGGNHTWSFHGTDVGQSISWLKDLIKKNWQGYSVKFPQYSRSFTSSYHSITSEKFHQVITEKCSQSIRLGQEISLKEALDMGSFVIDARGAFNSSECGYQKFVGLDIELHEPHGLTTPVLMDSTVEQIDGFRFVYYLPWDDKSFLVEDTRYSATARLNVQELEEAIKKEVEKKGWRIKNIHRKEAGSLPLPYKKSFENLSDRVIDLSGIFHDTTGYSLPDAVRLTEEMLKSQFFNYSELSQTISSYRKARERDRSFFRLLNRLLFLAAEPSKRFEVLQFFYRRPTPLIEKFYRGQMSTLDKMRAFIGKPPVSITNALRTFVFEEKEEEVSL